MWQLEHAIAHLVGLLDLQVSGERLAAADALGHCARRHRVVVHAGRRVVQRLTLVLAKGALQLAQRRLRKLAYTTATSSQLAPAPAQLVLMTSRLVQAPTAVTAYLRRRIAERAMHTHAPT